MTGLFVCVSVDASGVCQAWAKLPGTYEIDAMSQGMAFMGGFALLTPVFLALLGYKAATRALRA